MGPGLPWTRRLARFVELRSGVVIAGTRLALAFVFFLALWIDPGQPARSSIVGYGLLLGYLALAVVLVIFARTSWWWDHRLASVMLAVDTSVFLAAVYFTEGGSDFTSPFLAFFAFLMLAATIRWDWRTTVAVGVVATVLYLLVGLFLSLGQVDFDTYRFARRTIYMVVLLLVLTWFGIQRRERQVDRFDPHYEGIGASPAMLAPALAYAIDQCGGSAAVIAWNGDEEPVTDVRAIGFAGAPARLGPEEYDPEAEAAKAARLFDRPRGRQLVWRNAARPRARERVSDEPLAVLLGIDSALALPLSGSSGGGEILVLGIRAPSADHVEIGARIAREIADAFDRQAATALVHAAAVAHTRDAIARDLHDSVAQALAGASFRLEALRTWIQAGKDPEPEIAAIKAALRGEQAHVRGLIARLRAGGEASGEADLGEALESLAGELSRQWGVDVASLRAGSPVTVNDWVAHEIMQIVREAVANGVRHGHAKRLTFAARHTDEGIALDVIDDGRGFPADSVGLKPWSLFGRVKALGGQMALASDATGTRIEIALPLENNR